MENNLTSTLEACRSVMIGCNELLTTSRSKSQKRELLQSCLNATRMAASALLIGSPKALYYCSKSAELCKKSLKSIKKEYYPDFQNYIEACKMHYNEEMNLA